MSLSVQMADSSSPDSRFPRAARWTLYILGGLIGLILAVAVLLPQFFSSEQLKSYVIPPMEDATGREVQIDEIGLRVLWTPAVNVSGFRLANRKGYGPEPAVEAGELNVEVALWPLFTGSIEPTAIELVDPVIRYEADEDGTTNWDDLMAADTTQAEETEGGATLPVPVSNFRTTGAQIRYVDRSTGQTLFLDFDAQLSALPDGDAIASTGTFNVASLRAVLPSVQADTMTVTDAQLDYDVRAALSAGRVDLSTFTLATAPITVSTTGTVTRLNTRPTLDLTIETTEADLAKLASFAPAAAVEGLNPRGTLQLKTAIRGPLPDSTGSMDSLSVDGKGQLTGIGVDYQGRSLLRDLSADLALSLGSASLQSIQGQLLGASLSGAVGVQQFMTEPAVDLNLETGAMNLTDLTAFAPPEQVEGYNPQGTLQLSLAVSGPIPDGADAVDALTIDGSGELASVGVDYEGSAMLRDLGGTLAFSGTSASINSIDGKLLGKPLAGEITVRDPMGSPRVDGRLAGKADLAELGSLAAKASETEPMEVSGNADYDVRFTGPVDDPNAIRPSGQIRLTKFRYPYEGFRHPIEIPDATVRLTGTGLSMDRFTIVSGEQRMQLQTTVRDLLPISEGMAETDPAMAVDFTFTSDRLDLVELYPEEEETDTSSVYYSQLFAAALSDSKVKGQPPEKYAKELYGDVELPAYAVDGRVDIKTFLNPPQRIDNLGVDVQMRDRRLELRNLSGTTYGGQLAGSITFDQSGTATSARMREKGSVLMASRDRASAPMPPSSDLAYDVQLKGAKASAFLEDWTTLGRFVTGTLDLNMTGDTPLTSGLLPVKNGLRAKGVSFVANGGLADNFALASRLVDRLGITSLTQFKRLGGNLEIENGALQIDSWDLGGQSVNGRLSGAIGLTGDVDLDMQMDLPLSTIQNSKVGSLVGGGTIGSLLQKLTGAGKGNETIPVKVGIGGTMQNPSVEVLDKDAVKSTLQEMAKQEGLNRLRNLFDGGGE